MWFSIPTLSLLTNPVELTIPTGYYTYIDLSTQLTTLLNDVTASTLSAPYTFFSVTYSDIERKFTFSIIFCLN